MKKILSVVFVISVLVQSIPSAFCQEPGLKPWMFSSELSIVSANGNSRSSLFSTKNIFSYDWKKARLELEFAGLKSASEDKTVAENYLAGEKTSWKLTDKDYVFEKFTWDRNRFSGIEHRYDLNGGVGRQLVKAAKNELFAEVGVGYINEERIPDIRNEFAAGRAYGKYIRVITASSNFSQGLEYLLNFKDTADYRVATETALTAAVSTFVSLKTSFIWKRVNRPPDGFIKDDTLVSAAVLFNF